MVDGRPSKKTTAIPGSERRFVGIEWASGVSKAVLMNALLDAGRRNKRENEAVAPSLIFSGHAPRLPSNCFTPPSLLTRADEVIE